MLMNRFSRIVMFAVMALFLPSCVRADLSASPTIPPTGSLDLDTGQVLNYPNESADLIWHGTLDVQFAAAGYLVAGMTGTNAFAALTQSTLAGFTYSKNLIFSVAQLQPGTILAIKTKNGNYSKLLVTALPSNGAGSISLQFTTFGVGGSGNLTQPTVAATLNNYSFLPQGMPNQGIVPGSLFVIFGSGMAGSTSPTQSAAPPGLPTSVNGVSVTVTVVNQKVQCYLYYVSPTQIDAVLPSGIQSGAGTLVVTNNGVSSAGTAVNILSSAFGILSYNGTLAAAFDGNSAMLTPVNAANPNQAIVLWGTGIGPDHANDDHTYPQQQNNIAGSYLQVYIGGVQAPIAYAGRSQYPGVDQIVVTVPPNAPTGCFTSVVVVSSQVTPSNFVTIPVAASGKTCSDTSAPFEGQQFQAIASQGAANLGALTILESIGATQGNLAFAAFEQSSSFGGTFGDGSISVGSCMVTNSLMTSGSSATPLDAGTSLTLTGPTGASLAMTQNAVANQPALTYATLLQSSALPAGGGTFTIKGSGGRDVGSFSANVSFPGTFSWTNQSQITGVNSATGLTVTWSGGAGGGFVGINGSVAATLGTTQNAGVSFTCYAPVSAGSFTVPQAVLLSMPGGNGSLAVGILSNPQTFTASGLDYGLAQSVIQYTSNVAYNGSNSKR
jgi:uncharacterized protein (TIGR03437 family)